MITLFTRVCFHTLLSNKKTFPYPTHPTNTESFLFLQSNPFFKKVFQEVQCIIEAAREGICDKLKDIQKYPGPNPWNVILYGKRGL